MTKLLDRSRRMLETLALASDLHTAAALARLRLSTGGPRRAPLTLRLGPLGGRAFACRPGAADIHTLHDALRGGFHLPPPDLEPVRSILDLGSNVGVTMSHFAVLYPNARILGVELDHGNWELCRRNTARFGERVTALWGAAWPDPGEVSYGGEHEQAYRVGGPQLGGAGTTAPAYPIERLIDRMGLATVDFIKMDVEGAEESLLAEPSGWLTRTRCLKVEVHPPFEVEDCRARLEAAGMRVENWPRHPACLVARNPNLETVGHAS